MPNRSLSKAQRRLLQGLRPHGGEFDRYYRVISRATGEPIAGFQCTTALWAFRYGYIAMHEGEIHLTGKGGILARKEAKA